MFTYGSDQHGVLWALDSLAASEFWGRWLGPAKKESQVEVEVHAVPDDVCAELSEESMVLRTALV